MTNQRLPNLRLYTEKDLANAIRDESLPFNKALWLIKRCIDNKDKYWHDVKFLSDPKKNKWVHSAKETPLGELQARLNENVLAPHDDIIPAYVYGGLGKRSIKQAANDLLGKRRERTMLKIDMSRFFEHVTRDDVVQCLTRSCGCTKRVATIIADLSCVPEGKKSRDNTNKLVLARGFASSSRLAIWCNLPVFRRIFNLVLRELRGHNPKISVYMDDICITASRVSPGKMCNLHKKIIEIVEAPGSNLELNKSKTQIVNYRSEGFNPDNGELIRGKPFPYEFVGIKLKRNELAPGTKVHSEIEYLKHKNKQSGLSEYEKKHLRHLMKFAGYIKAPNSNKTKFPT